MVHKRKYLKTFTRAGKYTGLLHTKIQLKKMTKTGLIRLVIKLEKFIVNHAYEMYKAKLPRLTAKQAYELKSPWVKGSSRDIRRTELYEQQHKTKRKTKRKKLTGVAKAKFLARMNKGRRKKGLKPIRSR